MATRSEYVRANPTHKTVGYCCVFLAGCYVVAVVLLVGYLIALVFW